MDLLSILREGRGKLKQKDGSKTRDSALDKTEPDNAVKVEDAAASMLKELLVTRKSSTEASVESSKKATLDNTKNSMLLDQLVGIRNGSMEKTNTVEPIPAETELIVDTQSALKTLNPDFDFIASVKHDPKFSNSQLIANTDDFIAYERKGDLRLIQQEDGLYTLLKMPSGASVIDMGFNCVTSSSSSLLFAVGDDGSMAIWSVATCSDQSTFADSISVFMSVDSGAINHARWNTSNNELSVLTDSKLISFYPEQIVEDLGSGRYIFVDNIIQSKHSSVINRSNSAFVDLAYDSSDNLAIGCDSGEVHLVFREKARSRETFSAHFAGVSAVAWLNDDVILTACNEEKCIKVWNVSKPLSLKCIQSVRFTIPSESYFQFAVLEDYVLAAVSEPSKLYVFKLSDDDMLSMSGEVKLSSKIISLSYDSKYLSPFDLCLLMSESVQVLMLELALPDVETQDDGLSEDGEISERLQESQSKYEGKAFGWPEVSKNEPEKIVDGKPSIGTLSPNMIEEISRRVRKDLLDELKWSNTDRERQLILEKISLSLENTVQKTFSNIKADLIKSMNQHITKALGGSNTPNSQTQLNELVRKSIEKSSSFSAKHLNQISEKIGALQDGLESMMRNFQSSMEKIQKRFVDLESKTPKKSKMADNDAIVNTQKEVLKQLRQVQHQIEQLQEQQEKLSRSASNISLAQQSTTSPTSAESIASLKSAINRDLEVGDFEAAFYKALENSSRILLDYLIFECVSMDVVFFDVVDSGFNEDSMSGQTLFSQPLLLSLISQLAVSINASGLDDRMATRVDWLQESIGAIDINHPVTKNHFQTLLKSTVLSCLQETYTKILRLSISSGMSSSTNSLSGAARGQPGSNMPSNMGQSSSILKQIKSLIRLVQSILK